MTTPNEKGIFETITGLTEPVIRSLIEGTRFVAESEEEKEKFKLLRQKLLDDLPKEIMPKLALGLMEWAFKQMGPKYSQYLAQGFWDYFALAELYEYGKRTDFFRALQETPFTFPLRLRKNPRTIFSRFAEKYEPLVNRLREIKNRQRGDPTALRYELRNLLPEVSRNQLEQYARMEPSRIALAYLCWKHKLTIRPDMLKKLILAQKDPQKLAEKFIEDYVKARRK